MSRTPVGMESVDGLEGNLDKMLKEQYLSKGLQDVRPDFTVLMSTVPFVGGAEKAGSELVWPVVTSREHGFTALGQDGINTDLNAATKARVSRAKVVSYPFMGRTQVDNVAVSRAKQGPQAFVNALEYKISNLQESFVILNEQELLYGRAGLGKIKSGSSIKAATSQAGLTAAPASSAETVSPGDWVEMTLDEAEFADHIWIGCEDMRLQLSTVAGAALPVPVGTGVKLRIHEYDIETRKLVCEVASGSTPSSTVSAADLIHRDGFLGNTGPGLQTIFSQTSGTLLGIEQAGNPLWKVAQYNCGGNELSFERVAEAVARAVGRGLAEKLTLHVHPLVFASLMPDFNTLKATGSDYKSRIFTTSSEVKKLEHGTYGITFIVGSVEVVLVANPFIKIGHAFGVADGELMRCGSSDITYKIPGEQEEKYFHRLDNIAGLELRVFSDQALFSVSLNKHLHISGITVPEPT